MRASIALFCLGLAPVAAGHAQPAGQPPAATPPASITNDLARSGAMVGGKRPEATAGELEAHRRSQRLLGAVDDILRRAAEERARASKLPSQDNYLIPPLWSETKEDRQASIRALLDGALEVVTDAPVVDMQARLQTHRLTIAEIKNQIASLRERRLEAPEKGFLPGVLVETQASIDETIVEAEARIKSNESEIVRLKDEIKQALLKSGVQMSEDQLELLLDSVLGSDFIKLVTAFQAARAVDDRLGELLQQSNENLQAARRYFAMHAALFAMLVHAQDMMIQKIDTAYLVRLKQIQADIRKTREGTNRLVQGNNRADQKRALEANLRSQEFAEKVATFYRDYLTAQRRQLVETRDRSLRDLDIADNTYETVEASFQLRTLMEDAKTSFDALQRLEAPGFDQIFENEQLRREFESLTQKLAPPTS